MHLGLQLEFRPDLAQVSSLHRFLCDLCARSLSPEDADRIGLTAFELLENVIKYAADGRASLQLTIDEQTTSADGARSARVALRVHSQATPEQAQAVASVIEALRSTDMPIALYQRWMRDSARRDAGSGLGLARIRAEADMTLELLPTSTPGDVLLQASASMPLIEAAAEQE